MKPIKQTNLTFDWTEVIQTTPITPAMKNVKVNKNVPFLCLRDGTNVLTFEHSLTNKSHSKQETCLIYNNIAIKKGNFERKFVSFVSSLLHFADINGV